MFVNRFLLSALFAIVAFIFLSNTAETDKTPVIYQAYPETATVGEIISIYGNNFGDNRGRSTVSIGDVSCRDYDFDYISWSNEKIQIKMPTGTTSGTLSLLIDCKQNITGPVLTNINTGSHIYSDPMDLTVDYTVSFSFNDSTSIPLYAWIPSPVPGDNQRNVKTFSYSTNHLETQGDELDLYRIDDIIKGKVYPVNKKFFFTNYQIETKINPTDVTDDYDRDSEFYIYYTSPEYGVESDNPEMIKLAKSIVKDEKNPYIKSGLIYDWVVANMSYQYPPPKRDWRAIRAIATHRGDCAVYSFLFTALCRASGVPARPIAGHVIFLGDTISMHFWTEFYIPHYGWIPVDANYGDVQVSGFKDKSFYFGNLDNRHIAFSRGRTVYKLPGVQAKENTLRFLQKYHIYMKDRNVNSFVGVSRNIVRVN